LTNIGFGSRDVYGFAAAQPIHRTKNPIPYCLTSKGHEELACLPDPAQERGIFIVAGENDD
jgi:hypothetical protein